MDTTPERQRAVAIRERYAAAATRLRQDADLNDEARRRRLAEEWKSARQKLDALQSEERTRLAKREKELERKAFGVAWFEGAEHAISTRDAQDRASRLTNADEAAALLERAERNGDKVLAQAVALHAAHMGRAQLGKAADAWDNVLGAFFDARPHLSDAVEELALIERLSKRQVLNEFSLPKPNEVSPSDINRASAVPAHAS